MSKLKDPQRSASSIPGFYSRGNSLPERDADCLSRHSQLVAWERFCTVPGRLSKVKLARRGPVPSLFVPVSMSYVTVVLDSGGCKSMLITPFPQGLCWLSYKTAPNCPFPPSCCRYPIQNS